MIIESLIKDFTELYGDGEKDVFFAPGRINLIGEHIDYNGGYVFPCAIEHGTYAVVRKRNDNKINLASKNFDLKVSVELENIEYKKEDDWANYPKGIINVMLQEGYSVGGMDLLIEGNIPNGAGLSSSASLEVLMGEIINEFFNNGKASKIDLAKIGQKAENDFVGVSCGIMDQFAVAMGEQNKAILLNCNSLDYKYANLNLNEYTLVIMNTNKRRALNESKYNERRSECDKALDILRKFKSIKNLCDLNIKEFESLKEKLTEDNIFKRAEHAVYENERVKKAFNYLNEGKLKEFGDLLVQSHNSLRDLYEVTGKELDTIVEKSLEFDGCIGARMTGAGFGGCAIAIVLKDKIDKFIDVVTIEYEKVIGYKPSFYKTGIGQGVRKLS